MIEIEGVSFRPAIAADALCISVLGMQVFLDTYAAEGVRAALAVEALQQFSVEKTQALLGDESVTLMLAESAGHLVGFLQLTHGARQVLVPHASTSEIDRLYVHERFTAKGVGKALLQHAEAQAASQGAAALWLTAWIGNARAIGFYAKQGYTDVGATDYVFDNDRYENRVYVKELKRPFNSPLDAAGRT